MKRDYTGANNPNWKGGISKNQYRYRKAKSLRHPLMHRAHCAVSRAIKSGRLVRGPCEVCGETKTQAHHDDYWKPLEVRWLCDKCHRAHHKEERSRKQDGSK